MSKLYKYTLLKQNGTEQVLAPSQKKTFAELYILLNCSTIEIIPSDYYKDKKWGHCSVYGDEEARFNQNNVRNPHFQVLSESYDVVGNVIKEEVLK